MEINLCSMRDVRPAQDAGGGCAVKMTGLTEEDKELIDSAVREKLRDIVSISTQARDAVWRERVNILIGIMRPAELKMKSDDIIDLIKRAFEGLY